MLSKKRIFLYVHRRLRQLKKKIDFFFLFTSWNPTGVARLFPKVYIPVFAVLTSFTDGKENRILDVVELGRGGLRLIPQNVEIRYTELEV